VNTSHKALEMVKGEVVVLIEAESKFLKMVLVFKNLMPSFKSLSFTTLVKIQVDSLVSSVLSMVAKIFLTVTKISENNSLEVLHDIELHMEVLVLVSEGFMVHHAGPAVFSSLDDVFYHVLDLMSDVSNILLDVLDHVSGFSHDFVIGWLAAFLVFDDSSAASSVVLDDYFFVDDDLFGDVVVTSLLEGIGSLFSVMFRFPLFFTGTEASLLLLLALERVVVSSLFLSFVFLIFTCANSAHFCILSTP